MLISTFSILFFIGIERKRSVTGYPSDSNFYGPDADIGWSGRRELESLGEIGGDAGGGGE